MVHKEPNISEEHIISILRVRPAERGGHLSWATSTGFLLGVPIHPEDEGDSKLSADYMTLQPRRLYSI
jgi:hypothetical protein